MNKYRTRHIEGTIEMALNYYKEWVHERKHITITDVQMIKENPNWLHIIVTFVEERYE